MAYELVPLHSYVRFYQAVTAQLRAAWENLARVHDGAKEVLLPFADPLKPVGSEALLAGVAASTAPPPDHHRLWKPEDSDALTGINDVYEVVGRFSFQGEENANLQRVQLSVALARNEIVAQRARLSELAKLPALAKDTAEKLFSAEKNDAESRRREMTTGFDQLSEVIHYRAKTTLDAVRGVPLPDLTNHETAADDYRRYAMKVDQVYQTCLPFLRKAIANLYTFVACEVPSSWPDTLPLEKELPAELLKIPVLDSPELERAQATLRALAEEELQIQRAKEEITAGFSRVESELAAVIAKEGEISSEIRGASAIVEYVSTVEQIEAIGQNIKDLLAQRAARLSATGEVLQRQKQTEAAITTLTEELTRRSEELSALKTQLESEKGDEPVLFGKEEWRTKVAGLEAKVEEHSTVYGQRLGMLNQLKIDLSALAVKVQTEQAQTSLLDRSTQDAQAREGTLKQQAAEMAKALGPLRPARPMRLPEAEQALRVHEERRADILERIERYRAEQRRLKDEGTRVLGRAKQIDVERQHAQAMVQSAQVTATQGREAGLRQLAAQRKSTAEQHVTTVLGDLEKALGSVAVVFIDPARQAMMKSTEPSHVVSAAVSENGEKLAPIVAKLCAELEPQLAAQDNALGQIQKEFCDKAPEACRAAWG